MATKITARDLEQLPTPKLTDSEGRAVRGRRAPAKAVWTTPLGPIVLWFDYIGVTNYPPTNATAFYHAGPHPTVYVLAYTDQYDAHYAGLDLFAMQGAGLSISPGAGETPVQPDYDVPPQRRWTFEGREAHALIRRAGIDPIQGTPNLDRVVAAMANNKPWEERHWPKEPRKKKAKKKASRKRTRGR